MKNAFLAMIVTVIVGFIGSLFFENWEHIPELGVIIAIAVMGAFIIYYNEKK